MGYLRWGRPNDALPWFQKSEKLSPRGFGKSAAYITKLLERGGLGSEVGEFARTEAGFERGADESRPKKTPPLPAESEGDVDDDNVIPFPINPDQAPTDDSIDEERVGNTHEVVLSERNDATLAEVVGDFFLDDEELDAAAGSGQT